MARCNSCSAPLPTHSPHCRYCGVRNDLDLHAHQVERLTDGDETLRCPECEIGLHKVAIKLDSPLEVGHCNSCFGMFFSLGGIERALEEGVSQADRVKIRQIDQINIDRFSKGSVRYRNCPICCRPMRRFNYGQRSGVIVDQCVRHGIWLDNGELIHLLEWRKSGGHLLEPRVEPISYDPARAAELIEAQARADRVLGKRSGRRESVLNMEIDDIVHSAFDVLTGFLK